MTPARIGEYVSPFVQLTVDSSFHPRGLVDEDRQEARDAAWECAHDRLAFDTSPPCGCWPAELASNGINPVALVECDRCQGTGEDLDWKPGSTDRTAACDKCEGDGEIVQPAHTEIPELIPAWVLADARVLHARGMTTRKVARAILPATGCVDVPSCEQLLALNFAAALPIGEL